MPEVRNPLLAVIDRDMPIRMVIVEREYRHIALLGDVVLGRNFLESDLRKNLSISVCRKDSRTDRAATMPQSTPAVSVVQLVSMRRSRILFSVLTM